MDGGSSRIVPSACPASLRLVSSRTATHLTLFASQHNKNLSKLMKERVDRSLKNHQVCAISQSLLSRSLETYEEKMVLTFRLNLDC